MPSDTISTDPKLQQEARRAAAAAHMPRPPFDPKAVAREEWESICDKTYVKQSFDEAWDKMAAGYDSIPMGDSAFVETLSEAEYRQLIQAVWWGVKALAIAVVAEEARERSDTITKLAQFSLNDRLSKSREGGGRAFPDVTRGIVVLLPNQNTCPLHPNGCPDSTLSSNAQMFADALRAALADKLKIK